MHLTFNNINDAFNGLIQLFLSKESVPAHTRAGNVMYIPEPVLLTYSNPTDRVLFNLARDSNPFFYMYESLWMLAGRNDTASLHIYNRNIAKIASDDGQTFNGAYGHRWRKAHGVPKLIDGATRGYFRPGVDQLEVLIKHLQEVPYSRRAVLQMWTVEDDLLKIDFSNDVCCNTCVYFSIRDERLDMTVCNRSNDMLWGTLGSDYVNFSFLQEYVARSLGVSIGMYNQFANNLHVYTKKWKPYDWMSCDSGIPADTDSRVIVDLLKDRAEFDDEVSSLMGIPQPWKNKFNLKWKEPFIKYVAVPMCHAFHEYRRKEYNTSLSIVESIKDSHWKHACHNWIDNRIGRMNRAKS